MNKPTITMERFIEMLAERALSAHEYTESHYNTRDGNYTNHLIDIVKDGKTIETYPSNIIPCFDEDLAKEEIDKLAHPHYSRIYHGIKTKRDMQFEGFAKLLLEEMFTGVGHNVDVPSWWKDDARAIIARRAYDFAVHVLKEIQYDNEEYIDDHVKKLSDMVEWPKEQE